MSYFFYSQYLIWLTTFIICLQNLLLSAEIIHYMQDFSTSCAHAKTAYTEDMKMLSPV